MLKVSIIRLVLEVGLLLSIWLSISSDLSVGLETHQLSSNELLYQIFPQTWPNVWLHSVWFYLIDLSVVYRVQEKDTISRIKLQLFYLFHANLKLVVIWHPLLNNFYLVFVMEKSVEQSFHVGPFYNSSCC